MTKDARKGPAIQVANVSKRYRLYTERRTSLRER